MPSIVGLPLDLVAATFDERRSPCLARDAETVTWAVELLVS